MVSPVERALIAIILGYSLHYLADGHMHNHEFELK